MNKKFAFTLTEVLVTMGIIGVISALTVPTLMNNYQRKAYSVQLRKITTEIGSAADMLITEEGKSRFSATSEFANLDLFVTRRLKTTKTCASTDVAKCFASENYGSINGNTTEAFACAGNSYVLASSAAICMTKSGTSVKVNIDINGQEGPNIGGRDMFVFMIDGNGEIQGTGNDASCLTSTTGDGCYDLLAEESNWKMNY